MKKVALGKTGFLVSPVIYAGIVSMDVPQADSDRYVAASVDAGVNYFDVAPSYGNAEVTLGPSLEPYRKDVLLACKTTCRGKKEAEKELRASLNNLRTDWFDLYQLHAMRTPQDVREAFAPGGTMELLLRLKRDGVIRKLGISAHSERAALECLQLYPFDSVMFPVNWMLNFGQGIGDELTKAKAAEGFGLLAIKSIVERAWKDEAEREASPWPKSWCKPLDTQDKRLRLAAMRFAFHLGADVLIPPGNWECQSFMAEHADECRGMPYSEEDGKLLAAHYEKVREQPFFRKDEGGWAA